MNLYKTNRACVDIVFRWELSHARKKLFDFRHLPKRIVSVLTLFSPAGTLVTHEKAICMLKIRGAITKRNESVCLAVGGSNLL
jgi:hypothetical protein